jgi:hypothetical protein
VSMEANTVKIESPNRVAYTSFTMQRNVTEVQILINTGIKDGLLSKYIQRIRTDSYVIA